MRTNRPSPERFAAEIAARLDKVVPPGLSVRSQGTSVDVYSATNPRHASAGAAIVGDQDGRTLAERIETAASAILNGAQDGVMEILTEEWPLGPDGRVGNPGTRVEGDRLFMWFGEERAPVITLPPLKLAELEGAA